jgi:hypothetical protein
MRPLTGTRRAADPDVRSDLNSLITGGAVGIPTPLASPCGWAWCCHQAQPKIVVRLGCLAWFCGRPCGVG